MSYFFKPNGWFGLALDGIYFPPESGVGKPTSISSYQTLSTIMRTRRIAFRLGIIVLEEIFENTVAIPFVAFQANLVKPKERVRTE